MYSLCICIIFIAIFSNIRRIHFAVFHLVYSVKKAGLCAENAQSPVSLFRLRFVISLAYAFTRWKTFLPLRTMTPSPSKRSRAKCSRRWSDLHIIDRHTALLDQTARLTAGRAQAGRDQHRKDIDVAVFKVGIRQRARRHVGVIAARAEERLADSSAFLASSSPWTSAVSS